MNAETRQPRRYRSALRASHAAQTRERILDAAAESFATSGYAGTTLAAIARHAGVSVETVQANGPKRALLSAAFERAFTGDESAELIADRKVGRHIREAPTLDEFVDRLVRFVGAANARTSGLWRAYVSAADVEPAVKDALDALNGRRRRDIRTAVAAMMDLGARVDDPERATDEVSFLISPESYDQLVGQAGWDMPDYEAYLRRAVIWATSAG